MGNRRSSSCWLRRSWREVAAQALPQGGVLWSNHSATASLLHPCGLPMGSWVRYPCAVLRRPVEQACDGVAATMLMAEQSLLRRRSNASLGRAHRNQNGGGARRTCVVATETKQHLTAESLCPPVASGPPPGSTCGAATWVAGGGGSGGGKGPWSFFRAETWARRRLGSVRTVAQPCLSLSPVLISSLLNVNSACWVVACCV